LWGWPRLPSAKRLKPGQQFLGERGPPRSRLPTGAPAFERGLEGGGLPQRHVFARNVVERSQNLVGLVVPSLCHPHQRQIEAPDPLTADPAPLYHPRRDVGGCGAVHHQTAAASIVPAVLSTTR